MAALVGRDAILGPRPERISGVACTTVLTLRQEHDGQRWIRHYIRAKAEEGDVRVKTALRVAGALSNKEQADLYQVVLLDEAGPAQRADMRGRAIGAEVLFSRDPGKVPGMNGPFQASYVEGTAAANGEFYGERKALSLDEIKTIVTAMEERADCIDLPPEGEETTVGAEGGKTAGKRAAAPAEAGSHEVAVNAH
ncbi:hypothetical protein ACFQ33_09090 [Mycoplana ramosa]|uniref:Uncharacterized protein n=1 Tax=Mycoplana ramosa TaxID=40837 RepID=A0ABW3YVU5_MYCRA